MADSLVHLLALLLTCSGTDCLVYHILPSQSDPCPTQPCLTLSQFASHTSSYLQSNTTLIFQPGNHSLESNLRIGRMFSLQLIKATLPLSASIICEHTSLDLYDISSVYINRLEFIGCSSNRGESIGQLSIKDASFLGQKNSGTALELVRSTAVIERCSFTSNMGGTSRTVLLRNSDLYHQTVHVGGAVALSQSDITLIRNTFKQNSAEVGGAVFCERDSNITIIDCIFEKNHAARQGNDTNCHGGALYCQSGCTVIIDNSTFSSNSALREQESTGACAGGAIAAVGGAAVDISESNFSNNKAAGDGGTVCVWESTMHVNESEFNNNTADMNGGAICAQGLSNNNVIAISGIKFKGNKADNGGAIYATKGTVNIKWSDFDKNTALVYGGAVYHGAGIANIIESNFSNSIANKQGGAVYALASIVNISKSTFSSNKASLRGGAISSWGPGIIININKSEFSKNDVGSYGGAIDVLQGTINIYRSEFTDNNAQRYGGAIRGSRSTVNINLSEFNANRAGRDGGAVAVGSRVYVVVDEVESLSVNESVFCNNEANKGGAIIARKAKVTINNGDFIENRAETGVLFISESCAHFSGNTTMANNVGSLFLFNSELNTTQMGNISIFNNSSPKRPHGTKQGGAITSFLSRISLNGTCILMHNEAENGGAILAIESKWFIYGELLVANNTAMDNGGGAYLYQSEFNCKEYSKFRLLDNIATEKGGGIHAVSSLVKVDLSPDIDTSSPVQFIANNANKGGGLGLEMNAKLYILKNTVYPHYYAVLFSANSANYGGAVYVTDETNSGTCDSTSYGIHSTLTECFIQSLALYDAPAFYLEYINFVNNHALTSGSTLFGGLLDRCTVSPFAEVYKMDNTPTDISGVSYLQTISTYVYNKSDPVSISSRPVRVCFCRDGQPDFNSQIFNVKAKKGEVFTVPLVAVDQVNHTINATILSSLSSNFGGLGEDQSAQNSVEHCTDVTFSVFSPRESEQLILYAKGPCKDAELSVGRINVQFLPCTCPIGFQPNRLETTRCTCDCDSKLSQFITECHQENKTLVREGAFWISYLNTPDNSSDYEYLIHPQCPLDYCHPPTTKVYINLTTEYGSDEQCVFNRSGTLCGKCQPGFSLSLGSSRCIYTML